MIDNSSIEEDRQYGAMLIRTMINGGFVNRAEMAIEIAELMLSYAHNPQEMEEQKPFTAIEEDGKWIVLGDENVKARGLGRAKVVIGRKDARILECSIPLVMR